MSNLTPQPARRRGIRHGVVWGVTALAVLAFLVSWNRPRPQPAEPAPQVEVLRSELTRIDERLVRNGETTPFTGWMIEQYPDGARQSRSALVEGRLEGVSEGWYPDGQLQVREHFKAGVSEGTRSRWYASGAPESEAAIVAGKLHGTFRRWHENGQLAEEIELREGQPEGISTAYYPSGFLKARVRHADGKVVEQEHWKDGERRQEMTVTTNSVSR